MTTRELLRFCCAVCGPLSREEIAQFFPPNVVDEALPRNAPLLRVANQPDLPQIKKVFESVPMLQRLCEAMMARRAATMRSQAPPLVPESARCISAARYAALVGNAPEFQRLHRLYRGIPRLGVRPDSPRPDFWDGVLGREWLGAELLPAGQARQEIHALQAARYLLLPLPKGLEVKPENLPDTLSLGWGLLRADMRFKPKPSTSADAADVSSLPARAYWNLWAGSWENAYRCFHRLFRSRESQIHAAVAEYGGGLLLVAAVVAIRAHAPHHTVSLWLQIARAQLLSYLAEGDQHEQAEVSAFFDYLMLWDAVENRGSRHYTEPPAVGPLASLPMAIGAQAFLRHTGGRLPLQRLVEDILLVHRRGLLLLAFFAASSLLHAPGMSNEPALEPLQPVLKACSFKPLYEKVGRKRQSPPDARWEQLADILERQRASAPRWLYWDLSVDRSGEITSLEPHLVEKRPQSAGKKLALDAVMDPALVDCQDRRDMAMVALAKALQAGRIQGTPLLAEALVGHPRVRLVEGSYHRVVQVEATRPVVQASVGSFSLVLALDARQFYRIQVNSSRISIPAFTARMQGLVDYFGREPVELDLSQVERLRWLLARLEEHFSISGQVPQELLEHRENEPQYIIHASEYNSGYLFDLDVKHHPDCPAYDMPGQGERVMLLSPHGEPTCIVRDMAAEIAAAHVLVEKCPVLSSVHHEDFQWLFMSAGEALMAMQELGEQGVPVQWADSPALQIKEAPHAALRLSLEGEQADWLEVGAELEVDEEMVLSLSELLERYEQRAGEFLPLGQNSYLHLSPELADQVQSLAECLRLERQRYVLPRAALPGFVEAWKGESLPALLQERREAWLSCERAAAPQELAATLRDYQLAGFRWLLARVHAGLGACLADDMGLGKTLQALAVLLARAAAGPSLVVAPLSLVANWVAEAERYAPTLRARVWGSGAPAEPLQAGEFVIATYGQLCSQEPAFRAVEWNLLVLDESQAIKNPASRRAQVVCKLSAAGRICLTGTPVENSLLDLWSMMRFLNPTLLGSKAEFLRQGKAEPEHIRRMTSPLILRRRKEDVLQQLPPITEVQLGIDLSAEERALYESCRRKALKRVQSGGDSAALLAELMRLRRLCCHGKLVLDSFAGESSKLKMMAQLVEELLEAEHSVLIFSQFTDVLDLAQEKLAAAGIHSLRLDGATSPPRRKEQVRLFQEGAARVFLISLRAGGVGLNLTAADYVILLDPWWNPATEAQAASRSHRFGQRNPVTLCRLIARGTVEERIMQMHEAKLALAESVIREGSMPLETLRELLLPE